MIDWVYEFDLNHRYIPWQRNIGVGAHYPAVGFAQAGQTHAQERELRESVDGLTRRFAALTLNDHNVMNIVRHRRIFRTDR